MMRRSFSPEDFDLPTFEKLRDQSSAEMPIEQALEICQRYLEGEDIDPDELDLAISRVLSHVMDFADDEAES